MSRHNREFQSVLISPSIPETPNKFICLFQRTMIYMEARLTAQALGPIPVGYTLWVSKEDGIKPDEHFSGIVREIYQGWNKKIIVTIGTNKICAGTKIYY